MNLVGRPQSLLQNLEETAIKVMEKVAYHVKAVSHQKKVNIMFVVEITRLV